MLPNIPGPNSGDMFGMNNGNVLDLKQQEDNKKKSKRYILYCPKVQDKSGFGFDKFLDEHKEGEGNYLPHLETYGKFMPWYQIVDTKEDNKVVSEKVFEDDEEEW